MPKNKPIPADVDTGTSTWEGRPNKKSKWNNVDGDMRHPITTSSQNSVSSVGSHATLLTAANDMSGYTQRLRNKDGDKQIKEGQVT